MDNYDPIYQAAGNDMNIDPVLLKAIRQVETGGHPSPATAISPTGNVGLMQVSPENLKAAGAIDGTDPYQNIYSGTRVLDDALKMTGNNLPLALRVYHGGPDQSKWGPVNAAYPAKVAQAYQALKAQQNGIPTQTIRPASQKAAQTDALDDFLAGKDPVPSTQTEAPSEPDEIDRYLMGNAAPITNSAPSPTPTPTIGSSSIIGDLGSGLARGVRDVVDRPAELLATGADAVGLTPVLKQIGVPAPTAAETVGADQSALKSYNQQYGSNPAAIAGRFAGETGAVLPMLSTGGGIAGSAADVLAAGAGRVAPWLESAINGTTNLLRGEGNSLASLPLRGAVAGGAAGALTGGQSNDPIASQALKGAEAGALIGPIAGGLGAAARTTANAITGLGGNASPEVAQLAKLARDTYGIPITAPQLSTNILTRAANEQSSKLPFSGAAEAEEAQRSAWQRAIANTFGENADKITPDIMDRAARRLGTQFQSIANRTDIVVDPALDGELQRIEQEAASAPLGDRGIEAIKAQIENIRNAGLGGTINGKEYQQITRAGAPLQRTQKAADPNVRFYAGQIRDALDDAFQRSASVSDQEALRNTRFQWRNMKTIEDLAEKSTDGNISPALLLGQVRTASSRFDPSTGGVAYTGGGPLGDLARIGQQFMKPQPNSTTADRAMVNLLLGGGGAAATFANPLYGLGVPAGLTLNRLAGSYLRSGPYANRVINSSINPLQAGPSAFGPNAAAVGIFGRNALSTQFQP